MKNKKQTTQKSPALLLAEKKYRTWHNYKPSIKDLEFNTTASETIPGQGYSVKDLVEKYKTGQVLGIKNRIPQYDPEAHFDSVDPTSYPDFDLSDVTTHFEQIQENISSRKRQKELEDQYKVINKTETPVNQQIDEKTPDNNP